MTDEELQARLSRVSAGVAHASHTPSSWGSASERKSIRRSATSYVLRTVEGNTRPHRHRVGDGDRSSPDEMMIAEPDDEDIPLAIQRVVPPKNDEPREDDGAVARDAGGEGAGR